MNKVLRNVSMVFLSLGAFSAVQDLRFLRSGTKAPTLNERLASVTRSQPDTDAGVRWRQRIEVRSRLRRYASTAKDSPNRLPNWDKAA